jgi:hypothetical protein
VELSAPANSASNTSSIWAAERGSLRSAVARSCCRMSSTATCTPHAPGTIRRPSVNESHKLKPVTRRQVLCTFGCLLGFGPVGAAKEGHLHIPIQEYSLVFSTNITELSSTWASVIRCTFWRPCVPSHSTIQLCVHRPNLSPALTTGENLIMNIEVVHQ